MCPSAPATPYAAALSQLNKLMPESPGSRGRPAPPAPPEAPGTLPLLRLSQQLLLSAPNDPVSQTRTRPSAKRSHHA
jgi:hypothetical protein